MKIIYKVSMDETTEYDSGWNEKSFKSFVLSILKNPHGYDEIENFNATLNGKITKVKIKKKGKEQEVNIKTKREYSGDEIIYIAEIWPIELPELP